jgi:hypothetical protein
LCGRAWIANPLVLRRLHLPAKPPGRDEKPEVSCQLPVAEKLGSVLKKQSGN